MRRGHLDRLVDIRALEYVESADDFLGLGEGAVADQDLAVARDGSTQTSIMNFIASPILVVS
jgi:hypothetical protein